MPCYTPNILYAPNQQRPYEELPKNEWNEEWEEKLPDAEVTRMEFDMKDQMIRQTIMTTQEDVKEIKASIEKIEDKLYE